MCGLPAAQGLDGRYPSHLSGDSEGGDADDRQHRSRRRAHSDDADLRRPLQSGLGLDQLAYRREEGDADRGPRKGSRQGDDREGQSEQPGNVARTEAEGLLRPQRGHLADDDRADGESDNDRHHGGDDRREKNEGENEDVGGDHQHRGKQLPPDAHENRACSPALHRSLGHLRRNLGCDVVRLRHVFNERPQLPDAVHSRSRRQSGGLGGFHPKLDLDRAHHAAHGILVESLNVIPMFDFAYCHCKGISELVSSGRLEGIRQPYGVGVTLGIFCHNSASPNARVFVLFNDRNGADLLLAVVLEGRACPQRLKKYVILDPAVVPGDSLGVAGAFFVLEQDENMLGVELGCGVVQSRRILEDQNGREVQHR